MLPFALVQIAPRHKGQSHVRRKTFSVTSEVLSVLVSYFHPVRQDFILDLIECIVSMRHIRRASLACGRPIFTSAISPTILASETYWPRVDCGSYRAEGEVPENGSAGIANA
jgi:hypothetical protein